MIDRPLPLAVLAVLWGWSVVGAAALSSRHEPCAPAPAPVAQEAQPEEGPAPSPPASDNDLLIFDSAIGSWTLGGVLVTSGSAKLTDDVPCAIWSVDPKIGDAGGAIVEYFIRLSDGRDAQSEAGRVAVSYVATIQGATSSTPDEVSTQWAPVGHLSTTWSVRETADRRLVLSCKADTSLVPTEFEITWRVTTSKN